MKELLAKALILLTAPLRAIPFTKGLDRTLITQLSRLRWLAPGFAGLTFSLPKLGILWSARPFPDIMTRTTLIKGIYQEDVIAIFRNTLNQPDAVLLDVGAHHGLMALAASKAIGAGGKIFAFEPNPASQRFLQENLDLNGAENVSVCPFGLSDRPGHLDFYANEGEYSWNSTFVRSFADRASQAKSISVPINTVDAFCEENRIIPTVIKVDTEGADFFVLKGATQTIIRHRPHLIIEFNPIAAEKAGVDLDEIARFLKNLGYELQILQRAWHGGYRFSHRVPFDPSKTEGGRELHNVFCFSHHRGEAPDAHTGDVSFAG